MFVVDGDDLLAAGFGAVASRLDPEADPALVTVVKVAGLAFPGALVEMSTARGAPVTPGDEVGRTKDAGWQIGVSRTVEHTVERVWEFLDLARRHRPVARTRSAAHRRAGSAVRDGRRASGASAGLHGPATASASLAAG